MRRPRPPITRSIWSVRDRAQPKPLPAHTITVRPVGNAVVYADDRPLPAGQWSVVLITPGIMWAIKHGDLEEAPASSGSREVPAKPRATVPQPAAIEKTDKRKPDKAGALAEIARRVADGEEARAVCKDIFSKYRYTTWKAPERAYERANERKAPARKRK